MEAYELFFSSSHELLYHLLSLYSNSLNDLLLDRPAFQSVLAPLINCL